ncbi:MAG TPA: hypothetical protein VMZ53_19900 [Kofleriaceae bacterium]|nr:hypothetical protein [Kofleriaceae bacterium]
MKAIAAAILAMSLAAGGCAHSQHGSSSSSAPRNVAVTMGVIAALVLATVIVPCAQCNDTFISPQDGARR